MGPDAGGLTHCPLDRTNPVLHVNSHATPLQVAVAFAGGAHGMHRPPQVFTSELLTHWSLQRCWVSPHTGGVGAAQITSARHSAEPMSWLTMKRFSTAFVQTAAPPVAPPWKRSRHSSWLVTVTTTTSSAVAPTASENPGPMAAPNGCFGAT